MKSCNISPVTTEDDVNSICKDVPQRSITLKGPARPRGQTDELGQEIQLRWLTDARCVLKKAEAKYREGLWFDCLGKIKKSLACLKTEHPPDKRMLKLSPKLFEHMKSCYLLSADCYIKLN